MKVRVSAAALRRTSLAQKTFGRVPEVTHQYSVGFERDKKFDELCVPAAYDISWSHGTGDLANATTARGDRE